MTDKVEIEATGKIHLMHHGDRTSVKFMSDNNVAHTSMFVATDSLPSSAVDEITKFKTARLKLVIEYEDEEYSLGVDETS